MQRDHKYSRTSSSTANMVQTATPMKSAQSATSMTPFMRSLSLRRAWKQTPMVTPRSSQKPTLMPHRMCDSWGWGADLVGAAWTRATTRSSRMSTRIRYIIGNKLQNHAASIRCSSMRRQRQRAMAELPRMYLYCLLSRLSCSAGWSSYSSYIISFSTYSPNPMVYTPQSQPLLCCGTCSLLATPTLISSFVSTRYSCCSLAASRCAAPPPAAPESKRWSVLGWLRERQLPFWKSASIQCCPWLYSEFMGMIRYFVWGEKSQSGANDSKTAWSSLVISRVTMNASTSFTYSLCYSSAIAPRLAYTLPISCRADSQSSLRRMSMAWVRSQLWPSSDRQSFSYRLQLRSCSLFMQIETTSSLKILFRVASSKGDWCSHGMSLPFICLQLYYPPRVVLSMLTKTERDNHYQHYKIIWVVGIH